MTEASEARQEIHTGPSPEKQHPGGRTAVGGGLAMAAFLVVILLLFALVLQVHNTYVEPLMLSWSNHWFFKETWGTFSPYTVLLLFSMGCVAALPACFVFAKLSRPRIVAWQIALATAVWAIGFLSGLDTCIRLGVDGAIWQWITFIETIELGASRDWHEFLAAGPLLVVAGLTSGLLTLVGWSLLATRLTSRD